MKLANISYAKLKGDRYWNLILETMEDVQVYFKASSELSAKQFLNIWVAMKGGQTWPHYFNQRVHQASIAGAAMKISFQAEETGKVSLIEGCEIHDKLLYGKLQSMIRIMMSGDKIRVSSKGGYSNFDDMFQTHEEMVCNENQMKEYLMGFDNIKIEFTISKPIIVIENESMISKELSKKIDDLKYDYKTYETLFNFKYRTENWEGKEFFKFFDDGIKNGLHTIIAETSLYDKEQFEKLTAILKKVMNNNPDHTLEVKLLTTNTNELSEHISNLPENLKLTLL